MNEIARREAAEPLAIDGLLTEDQRRLSEAVSASKPLPASNLEACRELLEKQRPTDRFDEIDQALADPIHDHRPQSAPSHRVNRTLAILDELQRGNSNRRFTT